MTKQRHIWRFMKGVLEEHGMPCLPLLQDLLGSILAPVILAPAGISPPPTAPRHAHGALRYTKPIIHSRSMNMQQPYQKV